MGDLTYSEFSDLSEDQAEEAIIKRDGTLPAWWDDPIERAKHVKGGISAVAVEAHQNQFEQAYHGRFGKKAKVVGYERNISGQGLPGQLKLKRS